MKVPDVPNAALKFLLSPKMRFLDRDENSFFNFNGDFVSLDIYTGSRNPTLGLTKFSGRNWVLLQPYQKLKLIKVF